jgi:hypothetical protein
MQAKYYELHNGAKLGLFLFFHKKTSSKFLYNEVNAMNNMLRLTKYLHPSMLPNRR